MLWAARTRLPLQNGPQTIRQRPYSNKPRIDPATFEKSFSPYPIKPEIKGGYGFVDGNKQVDQVKFYRNLDNKMEGLINSVPRDYQKMQDSMYWRNARSGIVADGELEMNEAKPIEEPQMDLPKQSLDIDDDEDYAKIVSYIGGDQYLKPERHDLGKRFEWSEQEVMQVSRHAQVTTAGRIFSFSALVLLGSGHGAAGLGYGRGNTVAQAVVMAKKNAQKNVMVVDLWRGNSVGKNFKARYKRSYMWMQQRRLGHGVQSSMEAKFLLDCFGIDDVTVGKGGSRNRYTQYLAFFKGIRDNCRTPEQVANLLGRKLFDRTRAYYYRNE